MHKLADCRFCAPVGTGKLRDGVAGAVLADDPQNLKGWEHSDEVTLGMLQRERMALDAEQRKNSASGSIFDI